MDILGKSMLEILSTGGGGGGGGGCLEFLVGKNELMALTKTVR